MTASTMAFATLTLATFSRFHCRSHASIVKIGLGGNKWSIGAFLRCCITCVCIVCTFYAEAVCDCTADRSSGIKYYRFGICTDIINQIGRLVKEFSKK